MISEDGEFVVCDHHGCDEKFKNNKWARIKAGHTWFFQCDDKLAWCPDHIPEWMADWRARKKYYDERR